MHNRASLAFQQRTWWFPWVLVLDLLCAIVELVIFTRRNLPTI